MAAHVLHCGAICNEAVVQQALVGDDPEERSKLPFAWNRELSDRNLETDAR